MSVCARECVWALLPAQPVRIWRTEMILLSDVSNLGPVLGKVGLVLLQGLCSFIPQAVFDTGDGQTSCSCQASQDE